MKLLYVTDNGFTSKDGHYYMDAPNATHISHLKDFFDEFIVVARKSSFVPEYELVVAEYIKVDLANKYNIIDLNKKIYSYIRDCDAVICYCNNGCFASIAGKKYGKVVISYVGGDPYEIIMCKNALTGKILAPIVRYMWKRSAKNSDFGHYCHEVFFDRYPTSGKMMACSGVDVVSDHAVLAERIKKIKSITGNRYVLGLIGYTRNKIKGIDRAIEAVSKLGNRFYLEVVGRGETEKYIEMANKLNCADRIIFKGVLPSNEVLRWLDTVDIYIQPSRTEGLPRATIEAMSRGCPVVCSDAGALSGIINNKYVFEQKSFDLFANMIFTVSIKENMQKEAVRNFNKSKEFEQKERAKKYSKFYSEVIQEIQKRNEEI